MLTKWYVLFMVLVGKMHSPHPSPNESPFAKIGGSASSEDSHLAERMVAGSKETSSNAIAAKMVAGSASK